MRFPDWRGVVAGVVLGVAGTSAAVAGPVYLRSTVGAPWGEGTNEAAMNAVFGAGNWADSRYETVNVGTLFSATTDFIFMEGGDNNANELNAFLTANALALQSWVTAGGRLLLNSAPNEGGDIDFGFGVTLTYPGFGSEAHAANAAHAVFNGPFGPVATDYTGSAFSHAFVTGAGLSAIILDENGKMSLAEKAVGAGLALFGGMTTDNFHDPHPQAANLRRNIIAYAANAVIDVEVDEPVTLALVGLGVAALARRRRPVTA